MAARNASTKGSSMKNVKVATVTGLLAALIMGAACGTAQSGEEDPEVNVPCYTVDGTFVKWDDDCHDDKDGKGRPLVVGPPTVIKSAKQVAPTKAAPRPTRK